MFGCFPDSNHIHLSCLNLVDNSVACCVSMAVVVAAPADNIDRFYCYNTTVDCRRVGCYCHCCKLDRHSHTVAATTKNSSMTTTTAYCSRRMKNQLLFLYSVVEFPLSIVSPLFLLLYLLTIIIRTVVVVDFNQSYPSLILIVKSFISSSHIIIFFNLSLSIKSNSVIYIYQKISFDHSFIFISYK